MSDEGLEARSDSAGAVARPLVRPDATTPSLGGSSAPSLGCSVRCRQRTAPWRQLAALIATIALSFAGAAALGQTAVKVPKTEEKDKAEKAIKKQQEKQAQRTNSIEFRGESAFSEKDLRSQLK